MESILIADSELELTDRLQNVLRENGYGTIAVHDGKTALKYVGQWQADIVLMDLVMPDMVGEELCRKMRKETKAPIVILTSGADEREMAEALSWGADDYLTKPVSTLTLLAKMQAMLRRVRRAEQTGEETIGDNGGRLIIDTHRRMVKADGKEVHLTPTEYKLLVTMVRSPDRIFTREQLITYALEDAFNGYDRSIDTYIKELRKKIEKDRRKPRFIRTVHGVGYKFTP